VVRSPGLRSAHGSKDALTDVRFEARQSGSQVQAAREEALQRIK